MTDIRFHKVTVASPAGMKTRSAVANFAKNPRGANSVGIGGSSGTGGASTLSYPTTGGPLSNAPSFVRRTLTTVPTASNITVTMRGAGVTDIDPGDVGGVLTFALYARASKANSGVSGSLGWYNGSTFLTSVAGASDTLAADTWKRLPDVVATVPANTTQANLQITVPVANFAGGLAIGDTIDVTAFLLYEATTGFDGTYFDGATAGAQWQGAAHASRSSKVIGIG